jgi:hypothetical protein
VVEPEPVAAPSPIEPPERVRAEPHKHEPPPVEEFNDLIRLYRRRRDEIARDLSAPDNAELQALSIVCHQYMKRFGCSREDAGRVLRPLTVGRR